MPIDTNTGTSRDTPPDTPLLTADQSLTLHSARYGQSFHSTFGAVTEACHVYLHASGMAARVQAGQPTRVLEIGFGLGLNALLSLDLAEHHGTALIYHSVEHTLLPAAVLRTMGYERWLRHPSLVRRLFDRLETLAGMSDEGADQPSPWVIPMGRHGQLVLHLAEATQVPWHPLQVHALYLDAFSPEANPECWQPTFLSQLADSLCPDGKLSTYCAQGGVRRTLKACGLQITRLPGPPGKREILVAARLA